MKAAELGGQSAHEDIQGLSVQSREKNDTGLEEEEKKQQRVPEMARDHVLDASHDDTKLPESVTHKIKGDSAIGVVIVDQPTPLHSSSLARPNSASKAGGGASPNVVTPAGMSQYPTSLGRSIKLVKLNRAPSTISRNAMGARSLLDHEGSLNSHQRRGDVWFHLVNILTCCILPIFLQTCCKMTRQDVRHAWREKVVLCILIALMCGVLGFITFGFPMALCNPRSKPSFVSATELYTQGTLAHSQAVASGNHFVMYGVMYDFSRFMPWHSKLSFFQNWKQDTALSSSPVDISAYFPRYSKACTRVAVSELRVNCKSTSISSTFDHCHDYLTATKVISEFYLADVVYDWSEIEALASSSHNLMVIRGKVLNLSPYFKSESYFLGNETHQAIKSHLNRDATLYFSRDAAWKARGQCLMDLYTVGEVIYENAGCVFTNVILYISLVIVLGLVLVRFFLAVLFKWFIAQQLGRMTVQQSTRRRRKTDPPQRDSGMGSSRKDGNPKVKELDGRGQADSEKAIPKPAPITKKRSNLRIDIPSKVGNLPKQNTKLALPPQPSNTTTATTLLSIQVPEPPPLPPPPNSSPSLSTSTSTNHHSDPFSSPTSTISFKSSTLKHSLILVTCYSENSYSLRTTFDSIATTTYPTTHKLLFIVCDGIITGSGNSQSTPEIVKGMLELDARLPKEVESMEYVSVTAEVGRKVNKARVYAGWYPFPSTLDLANEEEGDSEAISKLPCILVVKCGNNQETCNSKSNGKPGNRGKRDSQVLLMTFLQRVLLNEPMSPLDFDLFHKIHVLTGLYPDIYELLLMVDADTRVTPDALSRLVAVMALDEKVVGVCGETRIANKKASWVTRIQVFEYYLSHHLSKAFESVFGGVTCLPGCYCMYRIKTRVVTPKMLRSPEVPGHSANTRSTSIDYTKRDITDILDNDDEEEITWIPILINPDVVETYAQDTVHTLHQKNLLLLGEDRFLTTLMIRQFPKRKLLFVPSAICKTLVPETFRVLLSQRRRWINSTLHNLLELVWVRQLCGVFCWSMQFVILLEILGTITLPAAICFTITLIVKSIIGPPQWIPLLLLLAILGLPSFLILLTTKRWSYLYWMGIYLLSLPLWNFVLPVYAFWHFDDFSWGETRQVEGEEGRKGEGGRGNNHGYSSGGNAERMDVPVVTMKPWHVWEAERREAIKKVAEAIPTSTNIGGKEGGGGGDSKKRGASHKLSRQSSLKIKTEETVMEEKEEEQELQ